MHNIVFKFHNDHLGLYGSDEGAMVAGNHELLGLSAYYRVIATMKGLGIHVPLGLPHRLPRLPSVGCQPPPYPPLRDAHPR